MSTLANGDVFLFYSVFGYESVICRTGCSNSFSSNIAPLLPLPKLMLFALLKAYFGFNFEMSILGIEKHKSLKFPTCNLIGSPLPGPRRYLNSL